MEGISYEEMAALAAERLCCEVESLRSWPAKTVPGAWFFATGDIFGASRVLIDPMGEQLWRPSSTSEGKHEREFTEGWRN